MHRTSRRRGHGVVIAGGGLAAQRAVETLRRNGYDGPIRLIADEPVAPYDRPPLSKDYLAGKLDDAALSLRPDGWHAEHDIDLLTGERATALDITRQEIELASGRRLAFSELVIATGATPRTLRGTEGFDNVHALRTRCHARRLRDALLPGSRLAIIGAGFIGLEVAATATRLGVDVTIIEAAEAPLAAILGPMVGSWFAALHRQEGVVVHVGARLARLHGRTTVTAIELDDGRRIACDAVLVAVGTEPATDWLRESGLGDRGVPVDAGGRTAVPGIYAAGDASRPFDKRSGAHVRTEHWEAAARQGAAVARAILGLDPQARAIPSFWSDQHGLRIQYLGHAHAGDAVHIDGDPDARDFAATFTRGARPVAALLVGRPHALAQTRRLLEQTTQSDPIQRSAA
jgi:NADPH-dependent 2,4-dienoyl-CoA reductase/sulfur reductase-like enzyme